MQGGENIEIGLIPSKIMWEEAMLKYVAKFSSDTYIPRSKT